MAQDPVKYEVAVGSFAGPLDALLALVERRKLDLSELSLAAVTEDFLRHVAELARAPEPRPVPVVQAIADFLSVATRLLLIKSRALLPEDADLGVDVEDPALLAEQLRAYQAAKPAIRAFHRAYARRRPLVARPYLKGVRSRSATAIFAPPPGLSIALLHEAARRALQLASLVAKEVGEVRTRVISLQKAISSLVHRLAERGMTLFSELTDGQSRSDTIVFFLAALHLARDQRVSLVQDAPFSDIVLGHDGRSA